MIEWDWQWVGSPISSRSSSTRSYYSKVRRIDPNNTHPTRVFCIGDVVSMRGPDEEVWIAHLLDLFEVHPGDPVYSEVLSLHRFDSSISALNYPFLRCTIRWFYGRNDVTDDIYAASDIPACLPNEVYFTDYVEREGYNEVEVLEGKAWLFTSKTTLRKFTASQNPLYDPSFDVLRIARCFIDNNHDPNDQCSTSNKVPAIQKKPARRLLKGELEHLVNNPTKRTDQYLDSYQHSMEMRNKNKADGKRRVSNNQSKNNDQDDDNDFVDEMAADNDDDIDNKPTTTTTTTTKAHTKSTARKKKKTRRRIPSHPARIVSDEGDDDDDDDDDGHKEEGDVATYDGDDNNNKDFQLDRVKKRPKPTPPRSRKCLSTFAQPRSRPPVRKRKGHKDSGDEYEVEEEEDDSEVDDDSPVPNSSARRNKHNKNKQRMPVTEPLIPPSSSSYLRTSSDSEPDSDSDESSSSESSSSSSSEEEEEGEDGQTKRPVTRRYTNTGRRIVRFNEEEVADGSDYEGDYYDTKNPESPYYNYVPPKSKFTWRERREQATTTAHKPTKSRRKPVAARRRIHERLANNNVALQLQAPVQPLAEAEREETPPPQSDFQEAREEVLAFIDELNGGVETETLQDQATTEEDRKKIDLITINDDDDDDEGVSVIKKRNGGVEVGAGVARKSSVVTNSNSAKRVQQQRNSGGLAVKKNKNKSSRTSKNNSSRKSGGKRAIVIEEEGDYGADADANDIYSDHYDDDNDEDMPISTLAAMNGSNGNIDKSSSSFIAGPSSLASAGPRARLRKKGFLPSERESKVGLLQRERLEAQRRKVADERVQREEEERKLYEAELQKAQDENDMMMMQDGTLMINGGDKDNYEMDLEESVQRLKEAMVQLTTAQMCEVQKRADGLVDLCIRRVDMEMLTLHKKSNKKMRGVGGVDRDRDRNIMSEEAREDIAVEMLQWLKHSVG